MDTKNKKQHEGEKKTNEKFVISDRCVFGTGVQYLLDLYFHVVALL